jgi:hypothetical protein
MPAAAADHGTQEVLAPVVPVVVARVAQRTAPTARQILVVAAVGRSVQTRQARVAAAWSLSVFVQRNQSTMR